MSISPMLVQPMETPPTCKHSIECSIALGKVQFIYKMANKQALNALVILELLDLEDGEGDNNNGRGKTREWLKRRRELGHYTNIVQELQLEDTNGFKEMMRMDYKYFKEILNLVEPDITPQEIIGGNKNFGKSIWYNC